MLTRVFGFRCWNGVDCRWLHC